MATIQVPSHARGQALLIAVITAMSLTLMATPAVSQPKAVAQAVSIPVDAVEPTFVDLCGTTFDYYEIPAVVGLEYLVEGSVKEPGFYNPSGMVEVTARATAGYELTGASLWSATFSAEATFADAPAGRPFHREICWMADNGISTGWSVAGGKLEYRPALPVERGAMAAFLYRVRGEPGFGPPTTTPFKDVPTSHPFYKQITWLADQGVTRGYADGTFRPSGVINRDAMAAFLYRLTTAQMFTPPATSPFKDISPTSPFYTEITWLVAANVANGYADGTFRPGSAVNRDAMAAFLFRRFTGGIG